MTEVTVKLLKSHGSNTPQTTGCIQVCLSQSTRAPITLVSFATVPHGSASAGCPERMCLLGCTRLSPEVPTADLNRRSGEPRLQGGFEAPHTYQGSHITRLCKCLCLYPHPPATQMLIHQTTVVRELKLESYFYDSPYARFKRKPHKPTRLG